MRARTPGGPRGTPGSGKYGSAVEALWISVAAGLIVAAVAGGVKLLGSANARERMKEGAKQVVCRHQWEPIPPEIITGDRDWCVKCGARRR